MLDLANADIFRGASFDDALNFVRVAGFSGIKSLNLAETYLAGIMDFKQLTEFTRVA